MIKQAAFFLMWIMFANGAELSLIRNQNKVYCMSSTYINHALTWIPKIEGHKEIHYDEDVTWMPTSEDIDEFRILKCNLMEEGGCPISENLQGTWEIINNASDEYGFIRDHRWHSLPLYTTSGYHNEVKNVSVPLSEKGRILVSILAKNNAYLTLTDGEKGFIIRLDAHISEGIRRSVSYCPRNEGLDCDDKEIDKTGGKILNDGEEWRDIIIISQRYASQFLIQIDDDRPWQIPFTIFGQDGNIGYLKHIFVSSGNYQTAFWKFHHYKALRLTKPGAEINFNFKTRNNTQLCLSILYHSGSTQQQSDNFAATMMMIDVSASIAVFLDKIKTGSNWQEYRKVISLKKSNEYEIIISPKPNYKNFAIGEIRVCHEKERLIAKATIKPEENDTTCSFLNSTTKIYLRKTQDEDFSYECQKGRFGENCDVQCSDIGFPSCENLQVCNAIVCSCLPGYYGETCEQECKGKHGIKCQTLCDHCRHGVQCNFVNGSCPNFECEDGYQPGGTCSHECEPRTYGSKCSQLCSSFCSVPYQCNHISGACFNNKCKLEVYELPTCKIPRFVLTERPEVLKTEADRLVIRISQKGLSEDSKFIKKIAVQYRLHQPSVQKEEKWKERERLPFNEKMENITLSRLTANTTYDIRVILYDKLDVGNEGPTVQILTNVTTLIEEIDNTPVPCASDINKTIPIYIALCVALCVSSLASFQC